MEIEIKCLYPKCPFAIKVNWPEDLPGLMTPSFSVPPISDPELAKLVDHHSRTRPKLGCGHSSYKFRPLGGKWSKNKIWTSGNDAGIKYWR